MKKILMVLVALVCVTGTAFALDNEVQVMNVAGGSVPITESFMSWRASGTLFFIPSNDTSIYFIYTGPVFNLADWLWVAPQLGYAGNWTKDAEDAADFSMWMGANLPNGLGALFAESEAITDGGQTDFYGFYSYTWQAKDSPVNLGVQAEFVNKDGIAGPHIGISKGAWHFEVQFFRPLKDENLNIFRLSTFLNF